MFRMKPFRKALTLLLNGLVNRCMETCLVLMSSCFALLWITWASRPISTPQIQDDENVIEAVISVQMNKNVGLHLKEVVTLLSELTWGSFKFDASTELIHTASLWRNVNGKFSGCYRKSGHVPIWQKDYVLITFTHRTIMKKTWISKGLSLHVKASYKLLPYAFIPGTNV